MGTRSDIIVQKSDGTWKRIYCHWDGYLSHNGKILFENYTSQKEVEALVENGDMSSLGEKCSKPEGHTFDNPVKGYCVYYGRDRGEKDCDGTVGETIHAVWPEADSWTEFTYIWVMDQDGKGGKWWVGNPDEGTQSIIDLGDALTGKKPITPLIKAFGMVIGQHSPYDPNNS